MHEVLASLGLLAEEAQGSMKRRPRYRFCWECSRKLYGNAHRELETPAGLVIVHMHCAEDMIKAGEAWPIGN